MQSFRTLSIRIVLSLGIVSALASPSWAACYSDTIDTLSEDGDMIILSSGEAYDISSGDESTAASWQEGDDVLVCGDTIIDKDENGERVEVTPH
jgi:hypothetical protein